MGCPSAAELAALVGVGIEECEKGGGGEGLLGGESRWEMEKLFRLEDLIVPTTCHGFHALETTPLVKVSIYLCLVSQFMDCILVLFWTCINLPKPTRLQCSCLGIVVNSNC